MPVKMHVSIVRTMHSWKIMAINSKVTLKKNGQSYNFEEFLKNGHSGLRTATYPAESNQNSD